MVYLWVKCQGQFRSTNGPRLNDDPARANHQLISHAWNLKPGSVPAFKVLTYLRTLQVEDHEKLPPTHREPVVLLPAGSHLCKLQARRRALQQLCIDETHSSH